EIDAVDADEAEIVRHGFGKRGCCGHERVVMPEDSFAGRCENVAAIAEAVRPEGAVANQLLKDAERHGAAGGSDEHNRARCSVDELLKIRAARYGVAAMPLPDAVSAAGRDWLHEPFVC